jgi:hypothetical protein
VEVIIKASRQRCPDSRNLLEVGDARPHHPLQATEMLQKLPPLRGAEAGHNLEHRLIVAARAPAPMTRDREPVRFVADPLYQA